MNNFIIRLPRYSNMESQFNKDWFTSLFPDSLISRALQDPEANDIDITDSSVKPDILNYLHTMYLEGKIPDGTPDRKDLIDADRYLNIDISLFIPFRNEKACTR